MKLKKLETIIEEDDIELGVQDKTEDVKEEDKEEPLPELPKLPPLMVDPARDFTADIKKLIKMRKHILPVQKRFLSYSKEKQASIYKAIDEEIKMSTQDLKSLQKNLLKQSAAMQDKIQVAKEF